MRARDRLTAATAKLMQRHGVAGTGIAEILNVSGVTRRSIYLNFPDGKAELVAAATRSAAEDVASILRDQLTEPEPITAFARLWCEMLVNSDFEGGCPILAAACSRDEAPEAAEAAAEAFAGWAKLIGDRLAEEGIDPDVCQSLSTTIVASIEGAATLSRAARSTRPLEQTAHHLTELVAMHRVERTDGTRTTAHQASTTIH
ncbi:TetR/AcrR family transcriptional regulator [[Mycobacterium] nativiensis]|uniref:TetR/AcrR family transcriptional regulator n=1 Tax=[Mycobacterium] nativiensis TaxID=2855503 RepID=A0ABU5XW86_9MYCO|nr:TetR/AcrR family transcriptional regulator [Mycolicibacter sp. MYC340]MEB3031731.1 TetR/AcrR family transcriptional regulator [Mycolicibacter sp. MYC340]